MMTAPMALAKVCTAALLFGRAAAAHAGAGAGVEAADLRLDIAPGGRSFRVSLDGAAWLESAPTFLRAGRWERLARLEHEPRARRVQRADRRVANTGGSRVILWRRVAQFVWRITNEIITRTGACEDR